MDPNVDQKNPKIFGFQKFIFSSPSDTEKFAEFNGTVSFFSKSTKMGSWCNCNAIAPNAMPQFRIRCRQADHNGKSATRRASSALANVTTSRATNSDTLAWNSHILVIFTITLSNRHEFATKHH